MRSVLAQGNASILHVARGRLAHAVGGCPILSDRASAAARLTRLQSTTTTASAESRPGTGTGTRPTGHTEQAAELGADEKPSLLQRLRAGAFDPFGRFKANLRNLILWILTGSLAYDLKTLRQDSEDFKKTALITERALCDRIDALRAIHDPTFVQPQQQQQNLHASPEASPRVESDENVAAEATSSNQPTALIPTIATSPEIVVTKSGTKAEVF
ncbi:hypothetical protein BC830DRAFT_1096433 [Chytriomyces sp. MP71]|nr:hypothetical protein BC830DRAFT_1096433 [Chytriomyces sp. MP71]